MKAKYKHDIKRRYILTQQVPILYPKIKIGKIRTLLYFREQNGLDKLTCKIGNTVLIDLELFDEYVKANKLTESRRTR